MLNIHTLTDAEGAKAYYRQSDYYLEVPGEWMGEGAARLGLEGIVKQADFEAVCDNINPQTGERLTVRTTDNRRIGWDFNYNASKGVGIAREIIGLYDPDEGQRIEDAHREAVAYVATMKEKDIACRVRVDGKREDRVTGNAVFMRVTHRTTRPNEDDLTPDMGMHDHLVLINATHDDVEGKIKAVELGKIKHDGSYYEAMYHNRLAANLKGLGYGVVRKGKGFELAGITQEMIDKFSRRSQTIDKVAKELGITGAEAKHKLAATTRLNKSEGIHHDLPRYWDAKLTDAERQQILNLKGQQSYEGDLEKSVAYAIAHEFTRKSVVDARRVYETAMRHGIGSVTPEDVEAEAKRQGLLVRDGLATTRAVLEQEAAIVAFGRAGRGCWQPMAAGGKAVPLDGLSQEQQHAVRHIWRSTDSVILVEGDAGTGKTDTMKVTIPGIDLPGLFLAPSASASRGTLREKGFTNADTIARFLKDETFQQQAKGGFIYVDEAPLTGMEDMAKLFAKAQELHARVILQGDRKQHASVNRGGAMTLLEKFAGCPIARLSEIWRQQHEGYKQAVAAIAQGDVLGGYDKLDGLGWIVQTPQSNPNSPLVDEYVRALKDKASVLVVAPTHKEGGDITQAIRERLKAEGVIGKQEKTFASLTPVALTDAEKGDLANRLVGDEVVQFFHNSGQYRAGQRVAAAELELEQVKPQHFVVYQPGEISLAKGDAIRVTANGSDKSGKHRLNNGAIYEVAGFTRKGEIKLKNGWVLAKDFAHIAHGRVVTSHASQGMTVDRVLIAMGEMSEAAMSREQFYVSVSRGKFLAKVFTNMTPEELRAAIQKGDDRMTATEFVSTQPATAPLPESNRAMAKHVQEVQENYRRLRSRTKRHNPEMSREMEPSYER